MEDDSEFMNWLNSVTAQFTTLTSSQQSATIDHLLERSDPTQLYHLSKKWHSLLKRDFLVYLPQELTSYLLTFLDWKSLMVCCCVSKKWEAIVDGCMDCWKQACICNGISIKNCDRTAQSYKNTLFTTTRRLSQLSNGDAFDSILLFGHSQRVMAVYFFNGMIATGSDDRTVRIWECDTGTCIKIIPTHTVADIKFDDERIVTASFDTTAAVWSFGTGQQLVQFTGHVAAVFSVDYNTREDLLVTSSADSTVKLWKLSSGQMLQSLENGLSSWITQVGLVPQTSDAYLVLCKVDSAVHTWTVGRDDWHVLHHEVLSQNSVIPRFYSNDTSIVYAKTRDDDVCDIVHKDVKTGECKVRKSFESSIYMTVGALQGFLGCGEQYDAYLTHGVLPGISIVRRSTHKVIGSPTLPAEAWPSKRGTTLTLCERHWLDGFDNCMDGSVMFAVSLKDHTVYLLKWRTLSDDFG